VIEVNRRDDRGVGIDQVDRIEPPPRPISSTTASRRAAAISRRIASVVNSK
jgi:hypothetical protein